MLNYALGSDDNEVRDLKSLGKRLVRALAEAIEAGGYETPPASVEETWRGRRLAWRLAGRAGSPCPECAGDRLAYVPSSEGAACDFCPACWSLVGCGPSGSGSFHVGLRLERSARELPPGMQVRLRVGGELLPANPKPPATGAEKEAALAAYAAEAERPLEIGRQVWMARMAFEGLNGVPRDFREARRWYEKAAGWGNGEALTRLGILALNGLGEPADQARAVLLCRKAAERGFPPAQTAMGRLAWDGVGVPEDPAAAVAWWKLSAPRGELEARVGLAVALMRGHGTERDEEKGRALLEEASREDREEVEALVAELVPNPPGI
jgi:hypothetical protein